MNASFGITKAVVDFDNRSEQLGTVDAANDAAVRQSDLNQRWSIVTFVKQQTQTQIEFIIILTCFEEASRLFSANRKGGGRQGRPLRPW